MAVQDGQTETLLATEPANQDDSGDDDQAADVNEDVDQGSEIFVQPIWKINLFPLKCLIFI